MKRFILSASLCLLLSAHGADTVKLENRVLQMEFAQQPSPHLARLVHKVSGEAVVAGASHANLFSLIFAKEDGSTLTIESDQAGESGASAVGDKLVLKYGKFPGADLAVEVTATCTAEKPLTLWSIRVANKTGRPLKSVRFPQVLAVPVLGDAKDNFIVLPALAGSVIENPAANWKNGQSVSLRYPGDMSSQFIAFQHRTSGLYLAGMDAAGHPMGLTVLKQPNGYRFWHEYTPVTAATGDWRSPYPVALGVTQGTWCDTADQYKRWALQQSWCAKKLVERADIPAWWKAGPDVHVCEVRTYDNTRTCTGSFYPQYVAYQRAWREKIDGPVVAMLAGWENHRRWTAGDYFPIFDEANAKPIIAQLRQEGVRPFFYLSGGFFTFRNVGRDGGEIPAAQNFKADYVIDPKTGQPKEYLLNESNPTGDWKRQSYAFCVGGAQTRKFFCDVVDRTHALGVDVLQMDQTVGGAGDACFSTAHGHAPGAGLYQSEGFWALLDAMRDRGKQNTPDFILLHEEAHEQLIPHLDGFHVREYYAKRWYRAYPGAVGVPLFDYLYHEFALGYGGDSAGLSKDNHRGHIREHALNLVTGRTPGGSVWSARESMFEAHADQIAVIRQHGRLLKTRAQKFLMLGTMLHPLEFAAPDLDIGIGVKSGSKYVRETVATPAILTSSWLSPEGKVGHLFLNIAETKQPLNVTLDTRNAPAAKSCDAEIYRSTAGEKFQPLWKTAALPKAFTTELAPLEVVFIELTPRS